MKKILMYILIGLLVALCAFIGLNGFNMGSIEVLSFEGIQERNDEVDSKIQEASKLVEKDYKQAVNTVQTDAKELEKIRQDYNDMVEISSSSDLEEASKIEIYGGYEIETLWVKLGNYSTSEGTTIRMDLVNGSNMISKAKNEEGFKFYNLKFTVQGSYISILDFISDIENDSTLGFKIEEFKMIPGDDNSELQATFVCKDIPISGVSQTTNNNKNNNNQNSQNTNTTNTTNTSNSTNTSNTANSSNTSNTANTSNTSDTANNSNSTNTQQE